MKQNNKGISPLIATLLLIAIAVSASVITYSWVMTMIGSQSRAAQTQIRIEHIKFIQGFPNSLEVTIRNIGSVPVTIDAIYVVNASNTMTYSPTISLNTEVSYPIQINYEWVSGEVIMVQAVATTGFIYVSPNYEAP